MGKWANPCGIAIVQGWLVKPALQATDLVSPGKNQFKQSELQNGWKGFEFPIEIILKSQSLEVQTAGSALYCHVGKRW